ncbi:MAG: rhomboid family intramembrane serine protease [Bacteroidaceae bacterium]|nr:rhomboid family intramembrane serine protease [Bacteroidaceae bacterium]
MRSFFNSIPPVTKNLLIINVLMWFATLAIGINPETGSYRLVEWMGLHIIGAEQFNVLQLVTYMFLHDPTSFAHVFFNMFSVFMFGRTLEEVWGGKRFLFYYITTGIGAGLIQEVAWYIELGNAISHDVAHLGWDVVAPYLNGWVTIGASGAVFGILLAFGMLFPNVPLYLMFIPVPIKAKWFVLGYGLIELFLGVSSTGDGIAHFAHLGGMLVGILLILYWRKKGVGNGRYY